MKERDFLEMVAEIVQLDISSIEVATKLESIGWDSLSNLTFIAKIDEKLDQTLDADLISRAETVSDLFDLVKI
jgi:acyl carrier protein